jgi:(+)-pinoresinol hydroxylase
MKILWLTVLVSIALGSGAAAAAPPSPTLQGKQVFQKWCSACHDSGVRAPGTSALAAKYGKEQPAALTQRKDLTPDIVKYFVRQGVSIMPIFRKTEISDAELNALADYLAHTPPPRKKK